MVKSKTSGLDDAFIRHLFHELKSPLAKMEMSLQINEKAFKTDGGGDPQKRAELYNILANNIDRLKHNVQNVLDFFSINYLPAKLKKDNVVLKELISCSIKETQEKARRKGIKLLCSIPEDVPAVQGDSQKIYNVLINLLDNALKFTDKGHVEISVHALQSQVEVSVSDTGIGLDTDNDGKNRLFEPFTEGKETFTRPGIGLFVCKRIIEKHGGKIWVESKGLNKGATFRFTLPA